MNIKKSPKSPESVNAKRDDQKADSPHSSEDKSTPVSKGKDDEKEIKPIRVALIISKDGLISTYGTEIETLWKGRGATTPKIHKDPTPKAKVSTLPTPTNNNNGGTKRGRKPKALKEVPFTQTSHNIQELVHNTNSNSNLKFHNYTIDPTDDDDYDDDDDTQLQIDDTMN